MDAFRSQKIKRSQYNVCLAGCSWCSAWFCRLASFVAASAIKTRMLSRTIHNIHRQTMWGAEGIGNLGLSWSVCDHAGPLTLCWGKPVTEWNMAVCLQPCLAQHDQRQPNHAPTRRRANVPLGSQRRQTKMRSGMRSRMRAIEVCLPRTAFA